MQATTPVVENVNVHEVTIDITADMELAGVLVAVKGTYNVDSNVFYPYTVFPDRDYSNGQDLEEYCEKMGWDYYDTHDEIQQAVENR